MMGAGREAVQQERAVGWRWIWASQAGGRTRLLKLADYLSGRTLVPLIKGERGPAPVFPGPAGKLLIVRPGGIGDAVFLVPIIRRLKERYPDMVIDVLCERRNRAVFFMAGERVSRIMLYHRLPDLYRALHTRYDAVVDTEQVHWLSAVVCRLCRKTAGTGFDSRRGRGRLFHRALPYGRDAYELDNFKELFAGLADTRDIDDINGCLEPDEESRRQARALTAEGSAAVHVGGGIPLRRWTPRQLAHLVGLLRERSLPVVLLGDSAGRRIAAAALKAGRDDGVTDLTGKTSLPLAAAVIERSAFFVGPDSGLLHLACAVGTRTLAVFGPGQASKWAPRGNGHRTVSRSLPCAPCTAFGYTLPVCRGAFPCMRDWTEKDLEEALAPMLRKTFVRAQGTPATAPENKA